MSESPRRKSTPETHLIERQLDVAPTRAWAGHVCITTDERTVSVPGTWHLELPQELRPMRDGIPRALALPPVSDLPAWRAHLMRLITLQLPGMQLRVSEAEDGEWRELELAAPTTPPSVTQIDRRGWRALLGQHARMELRIVADRS